MEDVISVEAVWYGVGVFVLVMVIVILKRRAAKKRADAAVSGAKPRKRQH